MGGWGARWDAGRSHAGCAAGGAGGEAACGLGPAPAGAGPRRWGKTALAGPPVEAGAEGAPRACVWAVRVDAVGEAPLTVGVALAAANVAKGLGDGPRRPGRGRHREQHGDRPRVRRADQARRGDGGRRALPRRHLGRGLGRGRAAGESLRLHAAHTGRGAADAARQPGGGGHHLHHGQPDQAPRRPGDHAARRGRAAGPGRYRGFFPARLHQRWGPPQGRRDGTSTAVLAADKVASQLSDFSRDISAGRCGI